MQTNVWLAFGVSHCVLAQAVWFNVDSWSQDTNLAMVIGARFCFVSKSSPYIFIIETCHNSLWRNKKPYPVIGMQFQTTKQKTCPLGGEIAHYLWATFHLHSWLLWEPLWLWWKSHKPLLGDSAGLTADTLMDSFVIGREGNDSVS